MGQPLILIHGMWCNNSHMMRLDSLFSARTYDCHRPTLPAHEAGAGQADAVAAVSIRAYVQHILDYIAAQNFSQPPVIVGHSMGGLIAQLVAAQIPAAALVLLTPASPAGINALVPKVLPFGFSIFSKPGFWKRSQELTPERARRYVLNGLHSSHQDKITSSFLCESGRAISEIAFWWADGQHSTRVDAAAIQCPVYVVSAGRDSLTPASVVKKVANRYANSTYRHWPDRCHWVIDDLDTEDMVYEIDGWLRPVLQRLNRIATPLPRVSRAS